MTSQVWAFYLSAVSLGFLHVLAGPDHYIPFIVMAKARRWSYVKTLGVTVLCATAHVGSSVLLGLCGVRFGTDLMRCRAFEFLRGGLSGWLLLILGMLYFLYGVRKIFERRLDVRAVDFSGVRKPVEHERALLSRTLPWWLFVIFVLGPCEPLIPLMMLPAVKGHYGMMAVGVSIFSVTTVLTMAGMVLAGAFGLSVSPLKLPRRYGHALAGMAIVLCAIAVQFLGW
jgi:hypothetical protein